MDAAVTLVAPMRREGPESLRQHRMIESIAFGAQRDQPINPRRLNPAPGPVAILMPDDPLEAELDRAVPERNQPPGLCPMQQLVEPPEQAFDREARARLGRQVKVEVVIAVREQLLQP